MDASILSTTLDASILSSTLADAQLERGSIPSAWVLSGQPETRSRLLGKSRDRFAYIMLWECGAVSCKWYYAVDEACIVLSGEGFVTGKDGVERRVGPGDVAFFPAGTNVTWRVPDHFRKIAVLKDSIWLPLALALKAWKRVLNIVGLSKKSALLFLLAAITSYVGG